MLFHALASCIALATPIASQQIYDVVRATPVYIQVIATHTPALHSGPPLGTGTTSSPILIYPLILSISFLLGPLDKLISS